MRSSPPPKQPDPIETADAQTKTNLETMEGNARFNQINQITPFGSTYYTGEIGTPNRTQHTVLDPVITGISDGLFRQIGDATSSSMSFDHLPKIATDYDSFRGDHERRIFNRGAGLLDDTFDKRRERMEADLYNRGIALGSEADMDVRDQQARDENNAYNALASSAIAMGGQEAARAFGQDLTARQQGIAEVMGQRNQPLSDLASLLSGTAPGGLPGMPGYSQFATSAPDIMGMTGSNYAAQMNHHAAQQGANAGLFGNIFGGMLGLLSDRRYKENIKKVGQLDNGLDVYVFNYKGSEIKQIGLMADEVEKVNSDAVHEMTDVPNMKYVDYGKAVE